MKRSEAASSGWHFFRYVETCKAIVIFGLIIFSMANLSLPPWMVDLLKLKGGHTSKIYDFFKIYLCVGIPNLRNVSQTVFYVNKFLRRSSPPSELLPLIFIITGWATNPNESFRNRHLHPSYMNWISAFILYGKEAGWEKVNGAFREYIWGRSCERFQPSMKSARKEWEVLT